MAVNSSLCTSSCQSSWCSSQPGSHRAQGQTLKGTQERGWGLTGYMHKKEFQLWILTLLAAVTTCDYAKHILSSLLSFVRRQHFIQSYTVSPSHRGKGEKDEMPQQYQLPQQPRTQHSFQREILLCKNRPQINWSPVPRRHRATSWKLKQNLSVQLRVERSPYELWVKLLAAQCQLKYAVAQVRRWNPHGFPEAE